MFSVREALLGSGWNIRLLLWRSVCSEDPAVKARARDPFGLLQIGDGYWTSSDICWVVLGRDIVPLLCFRRFEYTGSPGIDIPLELLGSIVQPC